MLRRISSKLKKEKTSGSSNHHASTQGAAVPYSDPIEETTDGSVLLTLRSKGSSQGDHSMRSNSSSETGWAEAMVLGEAAESGDYDTAKKTLKAGCDVNAKDLFGQTALMKAACNGHATLLRLLLFFGADIESLNKKQENALHMALESGQVQSVGVLLDYMHSVDKRLRDPFVLLRERRTRGQTFEVEAQANCTKVLSLKKRGLDLVHITVVHGQKADDVTALLISQMDVPAKHVFIVNSIGDMPPKSLHKFQNKAQSETLTVLNCIIRDVDLSGYPALKTLILVACHMQRFSISNLPNLELLDIRHNRITVITDSVGSCSKLKHLKIAYNDLKNLPRTLGRLNDLEWLDCSFNHIKTLPKDISNCMNLKRLYCDHNLLHELPVDLGLMVNLEEVTFESNKLSYLPHSLAALSKLKKISFHSNPLQNIPVDFPERAAEVRGYLQSLQDDPVPNRTVKLVLVGQEGVGKSTLLKALKRTFWAIPRTPTTPKTDGVDIKNLKLDEFTLRCFDCGGDVDFNETHNFFITQGALYLACFNLAEYCVATVERNSFLLGRLQLWLQYIFSKVPNSSVLIVGTHADHSALTAKDFQAIWEQVNQMLRDSRAHHRSYFQHDLLHDCLLCQPDEKAVRQPFASGSNVGYALVKNNGKKSPDSERDLDKEAIPPNVLTLPHILGYFEVSSIKAIGNPKILHTSNYSIEQLKNAIRTQSMKIINRNPEMPRKWADVLESLHTHTVMHPNQCAVDLSEVARISSAHGISSRTELIHLLQFMKAQGNVLYFPQLEDLEETVILDPDWLARIFAAVVSYRDTGISSEGFIDHTSLKKAWTGVEEHMKDKLISLLRHFGVCIPIVGKKVELFPCKLPIGDPDDAIWPWTPPSGTRQVTYAITFPSMIPPPLFSDLIVAVFRLRADVPQSRASYYANHVLDTISLDRIGCKDCKLKPENAREDDPTLNHGVHFELIAHRRTVYITTRGTLPCCAVRKAARILNKVVTHYEGLRSVALDALVCPGCYLQRVSSPHKFNPKSVQKETAKGEPITCVYGHTARDATSLITGVIHDACLPVASVKKTPSKEKPGNSTDFSGCPKLFIVLPVNKDGVMFEGDQPLVSSLVCDGFAAHLLCEFPDGFHLTSTPGFRLKVPQDFMKFCGSHVFTVLRLLSHMTTSSVSSKQGDLTRAVCATIDDVIKDLHKKFPNVKDKTQRTRPDQLLPLINEFAKNKLSRAELKRFLNVTDKVDAFGALRRLEYGTQHLWLCSEHYKQLRVVSIGTVTAHVTRESLA